jgi:NADPH-ferrihemoprotein reductase
VLYASQTGTAQEIARTIHAEAAAAGLAGDCMSMNELGFENLSAAKTPLVVVVASSTGDGDPPDNAAAAYVAMKKSWPSDRLAGVKFTVLGLGDSNYTRFMHVPRGIKSRCAGCSGFCEHGRGVGMLALSMLGCVVAATGAVV